MQKIILITLITLNILVAGQQRWADLGNFTLSNGQVIENCQVGYRIYGSADFSSRPVIVVPTWFGGTSAHIGNLAGPDNLFDSTRFTIIAMDALGNGVSSSPSTSATQREDAFPQFTIEDMVKSQHQALTQTLRLNHVFAFVGGSMGGMQVFQWLVSYPDFMDKAVSYVGAPWSSSYGRLVWQAEAAAIEHGLACGQDSLEIAGQVALIQILNAYTPGYRNRMTPAEDAETFSRDYLERFMKNFRVYDWYRQIQAMLAMDVTAAFNGSKSKAVASVKAETLIIVSLQDHLVPPGPAQEWASLADVPPEIFDNDCGHLAPGCEKDRFIRVVNEFLTTSPRE